MARLVKHGSQGVADAPSGGEAKDIFDMPNEAPMGTQPLGLSENSALWDKRAMDKNVLPEHKAAIEDVPAEQTWMEKKSNNIMPQTDGNPVTPINDPDQTKFANQGAPDYEGKKDSMENEEVLKKAVGHKTNSGL